MSLLEIGAAFHHVGIACSDLDTDEAFFAALGYRREREDIDDEIQGVKARFMVGDGPRIELVCNLEGRTVLSEFLRKGVKLYHVAYEVDDLDVAGEKLAALGARQIGSVVPGIAFGMRKLVFFILPSTMLVEVISRHSETVGPS